MYYHYILFTYLFLHLVRRTMKLSVFIDYLEPVRAL